MGKFDGVLLVSDYDDTLYGSDFSVSEENRAAINSFIAGGGFFTIATGRAHPTFAPQLTRERLTVNAPVILSNGSAIYDFKADEMLHQTFLPLEAPSHLTELARALPEIGFEAYHGEEIYTYQPNEITRAHLNRARSRSVTCSISEMPLPWTKVILQQEYDTLWNAQRLMREKWPDQYEVIFSNRHMLELTARGSTKGSAATWVADYLGIDRKNLYCVGDNQNDLPMLAVSAIPFAPSNCADELKEWGATILGSCDEHCVAQIIEILDQRY